MDAQTRLTVVGVDGVFSLRMANPV
jgi:hypothetical protein